MSSHDPTSATRQFQILQFICAALVLSLTLYVGVAGMLIHDEPPVEQVPTALPWIMLGFAAVLVTAGHAVAAAIQKRAPGPDTPDARLSAYRSSIIAGFALREAAGIVGLAVAVIVGDWRWAAIMAILAALGMVIGWPRRAAFDKFLDPTAVRPID